MKNNFKLTNTYTNDITLCGECPKLPEGYMRWTCCAECSAGDYDVSKEMVWCGKFQHWYNGSDGCSVGPDD